MTVQWPQQTVLRSEFKRLAAAIGLIAAASLQASPKASPEVNSAVDLAASPQVNFQARVLQCSAEPLRVPAKMAAPPSCNRAQAQCPTISTGGPKIQRMTSAVARGPSAFMHLHVSEPAAALQVHIGGVLSPVLFEDVPTLGALHALPSGLPGCPLAVTVAATGGEISDCRVLDVPHAHFEEQAKALGIAVLHNTEDEQGPELPASTGLAFGDYDNDGDADLYLANFGLPGILFRNESDVSASVAPSQLPRFKDVSDAAGVDGVFRGSSALFVDIEGDGDLDLYVGRDGADAVFLNQLKQTGVATFREAGVALGLAVAGQRVQDAQRTTGIAFGDYDQDGRLDLYRTSHITYANTADDMHQDRLFWNAGEHFIEATELLDNKGPATRLAAFAAVWLDVDRDGDPDLVVASDHDSFSAKRLARPNVLWVNDGPAKSDADGREWRFAERSQASGVAVFPDRKQQGLNAMGLAVADVDGDGDPDLAMSNIGPSVLLRNDSSAGNARFRNIAPAAGTERTYFDWQPKSNGGSRRSGWRDMSITWGTQLFDADNDGDIDLFMAGGAPVDSFHGALFGNRPLPNALMINDGTGQFSEQAARAGLADPGPGMGTAMVDIDGDGWLELAVFSYRGRFRFYANRGARYSPGNAALRVELVGRGGNRAAFGAEVTLQTNNGRQQRCFHMSQPGLAGGSEAACHFGLGVAEVSNLSIQWPDGGTDTVQPTPKRGQVVRCRQL